jgi:hypothetical protein
LRAPTASRQREVMTTDIHALKTVLEAMLARRGGGSLND